jgi:hypothetical protein
VITTKRNKDIRQTSYLLSNALKIDGRVGYDFVTKVAYRYLAKVGSIFAKGS